jgi:hypothetical protein
MPASHSRRCSEHCRVGYQCVAAYVVEMKMRVDDEVYLAGIAVDRL